MSQLSYHEQVDRENILRLRNLIKDLPPFCGDFFRGIEPRTSSRTRIAYAYDLHVFFDFLHKEIRPLPGLRCRILNWTSWTSCLSRILRNIWNT